DNVISPSTFFIAPDSLDSSNQVQMPQELFKRRPSSVRTVGARCGNSQEEINNFINQALDEEFSPKDVLKRPDLKLSSAFMDQSIQAKDYSSCTVRAGYSGSTTPYLETEKWVDWLDDYRRMKEAKLRAENKEKGNASLTENSWKERLGGTKLQSSTDLGEQQEDVKASPLELPALAVESSQPSYLKLRQSLSSLTGKWPKAILSTMGAESSSCSGLGKDTSSLCYSNSFYGGKLKKNFNLGKKIDDWWNAFRMMPSNWMHL
ncbi:hypothetical protein BY996DRAFT_8059458, partial [Phakopsora pachyrhizi]